MTRKRRNKILKLAKGYWGSKSKHFKMANQQVMKSLTYAYTGRRLKKRDFRSLWITRISAACKMNGMNYSTFMHGLKGRHRDQPQDAVRDGHQRPRGVRRSGRDRQEGAVLSEYPPDYTGKMTGTFLARNRLIAGLSEALCVAEARTRSGTLNTVSHAEEYGRPVFAVPGSIYSPTSEGTNELLRTGRARALCTADDVLDTPAHSTRRHRAGAGGGYAG